MRMMIVMLSSAVITVASARADAAPCSVSIVRAPEDVRQVIEAWIRTEPSCSTTLEVRVIPTDTGLYVLARAGDGTEHERVVPDPATVGLLVASWSADPAPVPLAVTTRAEPASTASTPPPGRPSTERPPIASPEPSPVVQATWNAPGLVLGATTGVLHEAFGLRCELDVFSVSNWIVGATVARTAAWTWVDGMYAGEAKTYETQVLARASHTLSLGGWQLRLGAGIGALHVFLADGNVPWMGPSRLEGEELLLASEVSGLLVYPVSSRWAVTGGMVLGLRDGTLTSDFSAIVIDLEPQLTAFGGLQHRL
jgi:hypothetical protein